MEINNMFYMCLVNPSASVSKLKLKLFFNWDSLHARLNSHYEAWSYKKKKHKKIKGEMYKGK